MIKKRKVMISQGRRICAFHCRSGVNHRTTGDQQYLFGFSGISERAQGSCSVMMIP